MAADPHLLRAIRGPITLITLGVLFTFDHFTPYSFSQTWPVLLIVFGLLSLLRRQASHAGPPAGEQPWPPSPSATWGAPPPPPPASGYSGGGGYRQSPYGASSSPGGPASSASNPGNPAGGSR